MAASVRTGPPASAANLLELSASPSLELQLTYGSCELANLKQQQQQQSCRQFYSQAQVTAHNQDRPASQSCQQSAITTKKGLSSKLAAATCTSSPSSLSSSLSSSAENDASASKIRERLFRLLSKVPIQVHSEHDQAAGSSSAERIGKPLVIKYYQERTLAEILELHFACSLVKSTEWSQHPVERVAPGGAWQASDEDAQVSFESGWLDSGAQQAHVYFASNKQTADGRPAGAKGAQDGKRQVMPARRARRPNQLGPRRLPSKAGGVCYQQQAHYEPPSQLGAVHEPAPYPRAPMSYDTFAYPSAPEPAHYSTVAEYAAGAQPAFSVFTCAESGQQAQHPGAGFAHGPPVQQQLLAWSGQNCQADALPGQEASRMIEQQQPQVACDPGPLYLASAGPNYSALVYAGPEQHNSASSSTCSQAGESSEFRVSFEAPQQQQHQHQCAYSANQQPMFGEPFAVDMFGQDPSQLGCMTSLCEPHLHPAPMGQPAGGHFGRQSALIGQQQ